MNRGSPDHPSFADEAKRSPQHARGDSLQQPQRASPAAPAPREAPHLTFLQISVTLNEFEQVCFDASTHDTVRFDDRTGFAVDGVRRPADLSAEYFPFRTPHSAFK